MSEILVSTPVALDFAVLAPPIPPVPLPRGGRVLPAREFSLGMQKLAIRVDAGDEDAARELLRRCVPGITEDEIDDLTAREALLIFGHCGNRLAQVVAALKNVEGAAAALATVGDAQSSSPSAPTTSSTSPSPASGASAAATGSRSPRSRSGARSTSSTG